MNKIELLAPAGNFEALAAAVESGADAVYLGGNKFSARAYADNFDGETLAKAVSYAHIRGVKVFVTINILLSDRELIEALDYVSYLYHIGIDAIIVQDLALLKLAARAFPDMKVHCSTQMTVHNAQGVKYYSELGAKRIVLARELPLEEVTNIVRSTGVETEIFIHGALCVSYSGQCLMSSLIGGRSGNRGRCAQPCRKKYSFYNFKTGKAESENQNKHLLSTRDLNTYNRLEELVESGVTSLKIEGRMKKAEYVAIVVKHYRAVLDNILKKKGAGKAKEAEYELTSAFNREFTEGYLFGKRNRDIVSIERPDNRGVRLGKVLKQKGDIASIYIEEGFLNDGDGIEIIPQEGRSTGTIISGIRVNGQNVKSAYKGDTAEIFIRDRVEAGSQVSKNLDSALNKKAREEYAPENIRKIILECKIIMKAGQFPVIVVEDNDGNSISYTDEEKIEPAQKSATSTEKVMEQLDKTGDTPYLIKVTEAEIEDNCYIPARQINRMRREVLGLLSQKRSQRDDRPILQLDTAALIGGMISNKEVSKDTSVEYIAGVRNQAAAISALNAGADTVYLLSDAYEGDITADAIKLGSLCKSMGKSLFYVLPSITRERELKKIQSRLETIAKQVGHANLGIVVSESGQFELARHLKVDRIRANYSFNVFNSVSASHLFQDGAEAIGLSPELNLPQIRTISSNCKFPLEAVVYGYMPVMTTEYCPVSLQQGDSCSDAGGCINSDYGIIDEKGKIFRVIKLGSCRTQLLNSNILLLAEELEDIISSGITKLRADFYFESPEEISNIMKLYRDKNFDENDRLMIERIKDKGFTKGHFYRGVD
jgi:U32 family peptidase